jgi:beta-galactosidase
VKDSLRDMIRIHRNHPSIIVWSMGNEPFFSEKSVMPQVRNFLKELVAYSHELDPTRPAAIGGCQRGDIDRLGDVAGYNGDGARLFVNPGIPSVVTEYGSTMADRPGKYEPGWGDLPGTPGADRNRSVRGVCRGAAARRSGARSTTAALPGAIRRDGHG